MAPIWNIGASPGNAVKVIIEFPVLVNWQAVCRPSLVSKSALSDQEWKIVHRFRVALLEGQIQAPADQHVRGLTF